MGSCAINHVIWSPAMKNTTMQQNLCCTKSPSKLADNEWGSENKSATQINDFDEAEKLGETNEVKHL